MFNGLCGVAQPIVEAVLAHAREPDNLGIGGNMTTTTITSARARISVVKTRRLTFIIGAPIRDPVRCAVDRAPVADRGIGVGHEALDLLSIPAQPPDSAADNERLGVRRNIIFEPKTRKLPSIRVITLARLARRKCKYNAAERHTVAFEHEYLRANAGPFANVMPLHHVVDFRLSGGSQSASGAPLSVEYRAGRLHFTYLTSSHAPTAVGMSWHHGSGSAMIR